MEWSKWKDEWSLTEKEMECTVKGNKVENRRIIRSTYRRIAEISGDRQISAVTMTCAMTWGVTCDVT